MDGQGEIAAPTGAEAEAAYEKFVWDNLRRNSFAHYWHGMLGMTGFRLVMAPTFLPAYLAQLSGSSLVVGLGIALLQFGSVVSPMVVANKIEHRKQLFPMAMWIGGGMRAAILGMSIFGWLLSGEALLYGLLAMLLAFGLFSGGQRVIFQAIFAKVIPIHRRGRLQAVRNMVGGLVAAVLAYAAGRYLIEGQVWGNGYSTTFLLAFVLTSMGLIGMRILLKEPDPPTLREQVGLWERLKDCPALLREDPQFALFLAAQAMAVASVMAAPFYTLYAGTKIELTGATLGALSLAYLGADTVMNMVWGNLADRFGYRVPFICALALWAASLVLLIVSPSLPMFCAAFFGLGAAQAGYGMCSQTMILEYGTRDDIALRLAISATMEGSLTATMPLLGGLVATLAGYPVVFVAAMVCQGAALLLLITKVKDPRHRVA